MASNIDDTVPAFRSFALSAPVRGNFGRAKSEITELQSQVTTLQSQVNSLQTSVNTLRSDLNTLQTSVQRATVHYATTAPASPVNGQMWFHSNTRVLSVWHAGTWHPIN